MQKKIFEATRIGNLELKNRLWRSATWLNLADEKGHLTPELISRYEELARGGVGTIITGCAHIIEDEQPNRVCRRLICILKLSCCFYLIKTCGNQSS
jgi:2,4-dienoyl-CoA reductase-like NADH-dependent reductase (Old Yellow Enzyme family)